MRSKGRRFLLSDEHVLKLTGCVNVLKHNDSSTLNGLLKKYFKNKESLSSLEADVSKLG